MSEIYYYQHLPREKQKIYYQILSGLTSLAPSFPVQKCPSEDLSELFSLVRLDHPEIFYAPTFTYRFYSHADTVEFIPEYLFRKKEIQEHQKAIASRIQKLIRPAMELDDVGKELYIHDFICKNVRYDKLKKAYSHEIIGPLTQGVGVCEGIAKTVKVLCDALHLPCIVAFCHNNPEKNIRYRHAWNVIRLGSSWYHLDATFDNTLSHQNGEVEEELRYDYVNLDDTAFFRDHEPLVWQVPACSDRSHFYYLTKKLSFTKTEDVARRCAQCAKKGRPLTFHWRGSFLTKEVLVTLCRLFEEAGAARGKVPLLSLNWPQAVMRLRYEDAPEGTLSTTNVHMEDADEGNIPEDGAAKH